MNKLKVPLTDTYFITLFEGERNSTYHIGKSGTVLMNSNFIASHMQMNYYSDGKVLCKLSDLTEEKAQKVFEGAEISSPYINYNDRSTSFNNALESFDSFVKSTGWDTAPDRTWIIIPKPSKQLKGKKIMMEFNVGALDFGRGEYKMDLEVFMSPITRTSKTTKFSMYVPKWLHDKCMTDPDIEKRPQQDFIESETISELHRVIGKRVNQAHNIYEIEEGAKGSKKIICINFSSTERITKDNWNHAYTGQQISTQFNFFVAYKLTNNLDGRWQYFSFLKHQSGVGTTDKGIKGIIDSELQGQRNWLTIKSPNTVVIDWTQEREDYLTALEQKFRDLSTNLNAFLKDLTEEKLQSLIENKNFLKLN